MSVNGWSEKSALPQKGWIRLLKLHKNGSKQTSGSLLTTSIESAPRFYALSYCWGSRSRKGFISLRGKRLRISRTLASALEALSHPGFLNELHPPLEYIWIDQICINQNDVKEREQQVQQMRLIYENAVRTLIWLGQDNGDALKTFKFIQRIDEVFKEECPSRSELRPIPRMDRDPSKYVRICGLPDLDDEQWAMLGRMLERPWFSRLWVIQEVVLSPSDPTLLCGSQTFSFETLAFSVAWLTMKGFFDGNVLPDIAQSLPIMLDLRLRPDTRTLDNVCSASIYTFASDPRDKVYGLLGIAQTCTSNKVRHVEINVDYFATIEEVYQSFVYEIISAHKKLGVLSLSMPETRLLKNAWWCMGRESRWKSKCTWIPDLRSPTLPWYKWVMLDSKTGGEMTPSITPRAGGFSASKDLPAEMVPRSSHPSSLSLTGLLVDRIALVSGIMVFPPWKEFPLTQHGRRKQIWEPSSTHRKLLARFITHFTLAKEPSLGSMWEMAVEFGKYKSIDDLLEAFLYCTTGGQDGHDEVINDSVKESLLASLCAAWTHEHSRGSSHSKLKHANEKIYESLSSINPWPSCEPYYRAMNVHCKGLRFFVSENGRIGTGDLTMRPGDAVCVLFGGDVPYILRNSGEFWLFAGTSYIFDFAKGQAVDAWLAGKIDKQTFIIK